MVIWLGCNWEYLERLVFLFQKSTSCTWLWSIVQYLTTRPFSTSRNTGHFIEKLPEILTGNQNDTWAEFRKNFKIFVFSLNCHFWVKIWDLEKNRTFHENYRKYSTEIKILIQMIFRLNSEKFQNFYF